MTPTSLQTLKKFAGVRAIAVAIFFSATAQPSMGGDIFVSPAATDGDADGTSWKNAFLFMQDALAIAGSGDTVHVARGTYYPDDGAAVENNDPSATFAPPKGVNLLGGYDFEGGKRDPDSYPTILSGDIRQDDVNTDGNSIAEIPTHQVGTNAIHVVSLAALVGIDGFTITAGNASDGGSTNGTYGGALLITDGGTAVRDCQFAGNTCTERGGAVMVNGVDAQFVNCAFAGNTSNARGGAFATITLATPTLINCVFLGNQAERGGALNFNASSPVLTNCSISGNSGTIAGGGIRAVGSALTLRNTVIWNNHADGSSTAASSSLDLASGSNSDETSCRIQTPTSTWNPMFSSPPNPGAAPSSVGNLDLRRGSNLAEVGNNSFNSELLDIAGRPRVLVVAIDIGAYEADLEVFVDSTATGANDGSSWANAFVELQDALADSQRGDQIRVAAGVYYPDQGVGQTNNDRESLFQIGFSVAIIGGYPAGGGARDVNAHVTILSGDLEQDDINLDGNRITEDVDELFGSNAYKVVFAENGVILSGVTITAGLADGSSFFDEGAGIYATGGDLTFEACRLIGNKATLRGGGISGLSIQRLVLSDCVFEANAVVSPASDASGGGAYIDTVSETVLRHCRFEDNSVRVLSGSGVSAGAAFFNSGNPGVVGDSCLIEDCSVRGNWSSSPGISGNIVKINATSINSITRCDLSGNYRQGGRLTSVLSLSAVNSNTTIADCIIHGNRATSSVEIGGDVQALVLLNTTIARNDEDSSIRRNGAASDGSIAIGNCFVDKTPGPIDGFSLFRSHSLIAGFGADGDGNLPGNTVPGFIDPRPVAEAPTIAGDYRLIPTSLLIDAGGAATTSIIDLLGNNRYFDGDVNGSAIIDIGAYEFNGAVIAPEIEITAIVYNPANGQVTLSVESSPATSYTAQASPDLRTGSWSKVQSGSLNTGSNTVIIPGSAYGWPLDRLFLRLVAP